MQGTVMEKFFTMHMHKFKSAYLKSEPVSIEQRPPWEEAYRYAMVRLQRYTRAFPLPRRPL